MLSFFLKRIIKFQEYVISDLSREMLNKAQNRLSPFSVSGKLKFQTLNLESFNSRTKFDYIIGSDIIHHLENPVECLRNLRLHLNEGGKIIILETNIYNPLSWPGIIGREHEMRAILNTPKNLLNWLNEAGFNSASVVPAPSFTPSGPRLLHPFLNLIDKFFVRVPRLNYLSALWKMTGSR